MIALLELQDMAEEMVFSLIVEAHKRLTIGAELASEPELLLFLDLGSRFAVCMELGALFARTRG